MNYCKLISSRICQWVAVFVAGYLACYLECLRDMAGKSSGYWQQHTYSADRHHNVPYMFREDIGKTDNVYVFHNVCIESTNQSFPSIAVYDTETEYSGIKNVTVEVYYKVKQNVTITFIKKPLPGNTQFMRGPAFFVPLLWPYNFFHFFHTFFTGKHSRCVLIYSVCSISLTTAPWYST